MNAPRWVCLVSCVLISAVCILPACGPEDDDDATSSSPEPQEDLLGPTITFEPPFESAVPGSEVPLEAQIVDPSGIAEALLYYRAVGTDYWESVALEETTQGLYQGTIPANYVTLEGVDYYFTARDASDNRNLSKLPEEGASDPFRLRPRQGTVAFPVTFTFDPPEPRDDWHLLDTGWYSYVAGFYDGENWTLRQEDESMTQFSVYHDHGSPYQMEGFLDYLLSPPMDLSSAVSVDLYWREWLSYPQEAIHRLLVSTGSPDPSDGEFVAVRDPLLPSEGANGAYARSQHVDLSEYAGETFVTLAFVYEGLWGDDWALDDLVLEAPRPDLVIEPLVATPERASPGEQVEISVRGQNVGLIAASSFVATLSSDDGLVTLLESSQVAPSVEAGAMFSLEPFSLVLDETHPTDVYVPLGLELTDGASSFVAEGRVPVGVPPVAHIEIYHEFADDLQVFIGAGEPEDPDFFMTVQEDEGGDAAGDFSWDVDLSEAAALLPPEVDLRWFLQVFDDSPGNVGEVRAFTIQIGEGVYTAMGLPEAIPDDGSSAYVYLPGRAQWTVETLVTEPSTVAPGDTVALTLKLLNSAAPPAEPVYGTLESQDNQALVLTAEPISFSYATSESSGEGHLEPRAPFSFSVLSGHVDSSPLRFLLTLRDDVDEWQVPLTVDVPYPVLEGLVLTWEETPGTSAGIPGAPEPGEVGGFRVRIRNTGALPTFAPTTVTLSLSEGSDAEVSGEPVVLSPDGDLTPEGQPIPSSGGGKSALIPATLAVDPALPELSLELFMTDTVLSVGERRSLTFGEVPWNPVFPAPDAQGDASAYPLDLAEGSFRLFGTVLEQRFTSHTPFDKTDLFFYSFVSASSGYQYALSLVYGEMRIYQWYVSGSSSYWYRRYTVPSSYWIDQTDSYTIELSIDLSSLGMATGTYYGGASGGACDGNEACDYAPDEASSVSGLTRFYW